MIVKYKDANSEIRFCWPMKFFGLNLTLCCAWTWDSGLGLDNFLLNSNETDLELRQVPKLASLLVSLFRMPQ